MKFTKGMLTVASVAFTSAAFAQNAKVTSEKQAPLQQLLPGSYASIELRHATNELRDTTKKDSDISPYVDVRPTIGSTFFNDKLDTAFTWVFRKVPESVVFQKQSFGFYNETTFTVFENDNFKFYPYLYVEQGSLGDSFSLADIGPHLEAKKTFKSSAGELTLAGFVEPLAEYYSGAAAKALEKKKVKNSTERAYTLAEGETAEVDVAQKDPSFANTTELAVTFVPAKLSDLTVSLAADYLQNWNPKYKDAAKDGSVEAKLDGYATKDAVLNKLTLSYKFNDTFTLSNSARYAVGGLYGETYDRNEKVSGMQARFENRLSLNAVLF